MIPEEKIKIVEELHKPARRNFKRRPIIIRHYGEIWACDLLEMQSYASSNKNYRYILVVIDSYSKFLWTRPLKNKTALEVSKAMQSIISKANYSPKHINSDQGSEFYNKLFKKLMKKYDINHYSTYSTKKAAIAERVIRTLKNLIYKKISIVGNHKWLNLLQSLTAIYNKTKHSTIKMRPIDVRPDTSLDVFTPKKVITPSKRKKMQVGDIVRISRHKGVFSKGYEINWSPELFKIIRVNASNPITFLLNDMDGQPIKGCFYEEELQKTQLPDVYLVEKILKHRIHNGNKQVLVQWLGFPQRSWINKSDILK